MLRSILDNPATAFAVAHNLARVRLPIRDEPAAGCHKPRSTPGASSSVTLSSSALSEGMPMPSFKGYYRKIYSTFGYLLNERTAISPEVLNATQKGLAVPVPRALRDYYLVASWPAQRREVNCGASWRSWGW